MKKILIIDDEYAILELLSVILSDFGDYEVSTASSGSEGMEAMQRNPPDLVILDFMMPIMNGADVLRAMRADNVLRSIPVVMVSAAPRAVVEENLPYQAFLSKPFEVAELNRTIKELVN